MREIFEQLDQLRRTEGKVAMATLVDTRGTTPRKEGAKMWVGAGGRILGSVTIGGCVDAQVMAEAEEVLGSDAAHLLEMTLGDEEAWEIGLTCGGTIEVFVEPVPLREPEAGPLALYETLRARLEQGGRGALVTRLDPLAAGAKLLLLDDGRTRGGLGDTALEEAAVARARELLDRGGSRTLEVALGERTHRLFVEVYGPPPTLLVVGAGHVAMPLTELARILGYRTVVVDGRPRMATRERFPHADELLVGIPSELVRALPLTPTTAVILVAHDYKYDLPVLRHVLAAPVGYVGMLGSRRRGEAILKLLREEGVPEETLRRIHVPIGLDLGAQTAPEIALAILAEVLAARQGGGGRPLREVKGGRG
ncbi:MAG: XdhC family protein [Candidatus Rokubacteria bacterium]|nr:XdhC family protein [Candidatus Rokubacteria bacterium]